MGLLGRWYRTIKRQTADEQQRLPVGFVRRLGGGLQSFVTAVHWRRAGRLVGSATVTVTPTGATIDAGGGAQWVGFDFTRLHFGRRAWWLCPECSRRCAILYGPGFVCRKCAGVDYYRVQQNADRLEMIDNKLNRLRRRLGVKDGATRNRLPPKPARMHWKTYARLEEEYRALQMLWEDEYVEQLGRMVG